MSDSFREIRVPGSTSNLGAGFDALAVALDLYLRLRVLDARPGHGDRLDLEFATPAPTGDNRLESAYRMACARFGTPPMALRVLVSSEIPMAAGLGSSAAAAVGGLRLYEAARGTALDPDDLLSLASALDGHPDNVSASVCGGITLSCQCDDGRIIARSWEWPPAIRFIVATPDAALETKTARGVLPASIPLADAVANLQRALLFVRALESGDYGDLREALKDRWHQPARAALVPGMAEAIAVDHPAVLGVCLSGAGPSVIALAAPGRADEAAAVLGGLYRRLGVPHTIRNLGAHGSALARGPIVVSERERTA